MGFIVDVRRALAVPARSGYCDCRQVTGARRSELRDALHPIPRDGRPPHDWFQARDDLDVLLSAKASVGRVLATAFSVLAPLTATVISALLSGSQ